MAAAGADYLKEDSCGGSQDHATAFADYGRMRDVLNATGRSVFFSLCGWNSWCVVVTCETRVRNANTASHLACLLA